MQKQAVQLGQRGSGICWSDPSAWVAPLVLGLLMALLVRMCGVNIPINDDFDSPGAMLFDWLHGNLGWHSFWQQHNESRLVVPRLLWLIEAFTVGWSTKHWMYASVMMASLQTYLLVLLLGKSIRSAFIKWSTAVCISLFLLHPRLAPGTFLRGSQGIILIPSLFIVVGLFLYTYRISFRLKLLVYVILAEISTLTFANGMIVWVLAFPIFPLLHELRDPSKDRRSIFVPTLLACLCGIFSIGSYFVDFSGTPISWPADGLAGFLRYLFSWIGAGLASIGDSHAALAFGIGLFVASAACVTVTIAGAMRERNLAPLERAWPGIALLVYVAVSGLVNALTRTPLGINNALSPRYYLFTMQMTIALAWLLPMVIFHRGDGTRRGYQKTQLALVSLLLLSGIFYALAGWQDGIKASQKHYSSLVRYTIALSLWREAPEISPLPISKTAPPARRRVHYLALVQAGLCPDYSGGAWLMKALKDARSRTPVGEVHVKGAGRKLKASGWAMDPVARTPFPAVLTVIEEKDSQLTPISVDLMSQQGPPVPGRLDTEGSFFFMGFSTYPLQGRHASAPPERLRFFAIDPGTHEAFPLRRTR